MKRRADWSLAAAGVICGALMIARAIGVFRAGPNGYSSGLEEEALFSVWKWMNHQPVYANAFEPPFAQSYFNWLFYWVYGAFSQLMTSAAKLDSSSLPTVARSLTLGLTGATMLVSWGLLRPLPRVARIAGSAIIAFTPLSGFWSLTCRPDTGATLFALVGLWCISRSDVSRNTVLWLVLAFTAFYCSWAFKQTYFTAFVATSLHFFLRGQKHRALWFGAATVLVIGWTIALGSDEYRYALLESQSRTRFVPSIGLHNATSALVKAPLFLLGIFVVVGRIRKDRTDLLPIWAIISLSLMVIASAKLGASDNYFLEPAALCSIAFLLTQRHWLAASAAQLVAPLLILSGVNGTVTLAAPKELAMLRRGLAEMKGTTVVTLPIGNLPWFQPRDPHYVMAFTYFEDRENGKTFAHGGIGGMLRTGRIEVFVCPLEEINRPFDGIPPSSLRQVKQDGYWAYFQTQPPVNTDVRP